MGTLRFRGKHSADLSLRLQINKDMDLEGTRGIAEFKKSSKPTLPQVLWLATYLKEKWSHSQDLTFQTPQFSFSNKNTKYILILYIQHIDIEHFLYFLRLNKTHIIHLLIYNKRVINFKMLKSNLHERVILIQNEGRTLSTRLSKGLHLYFRIWYWKTYIFGHNR